MQDHRPIGGVPLWLATLVFVAVPTGAKANAIFNFTFTPNPVVVTEFTLGSVKVTIKNKDENAVKIVCIDNVGGCKGATPPTFNYLNNDRNDEPFNPVVDATNCKDAKGNFLTLAPGASCNYTINFDTRDLHINLSGRNFGNWEVATDVDIGDFRFDIGRGHVWVTDPSGFLGPEPSTLALLGAGIAALIGFRKKFL